MKKIVLASSSPRRKELLEQVGVDFEVLVSDKEETSFQSKPGDIVKELALVKANHVAEMLLESAVIIGADTMVAIDGSILGKPKDKKDARRMLQMLQGNTHQVYTGVAIILKDEKNFMKYAFVEMTSVTMYSMTEDEIEYYVSTGEPMDKAGAYGIQGKSAIYVKEIHGDYNNVVGLPVARLYQEMKKMGIQIA